MGLLRINKKFVQSLAIISLIISLTVALPLTTESVRSLSVQTRSVTLMVVAVASALLLVTLKGSRVMLFSMFGFVFFFSYGILQSSITGAVTSAMSSLAVTMIVVLCGLFVASQKRPVLSPREVLWLLFYVLVFFILTAALGGLILEVPPRFVFQVQTDRHGSAVLYSQGITRFAAIGALFSAFLFQATSRKYLKVGLFVLGLGFLGLSFIGGARGDAIAGLLAFVLILSINTSWTYAVLRISLTGLIAILLINMADLDEFVFIRRMEIVFEGSLGARDELFANSIELISSDARCFFFGCGFDYFQFYFGYGSGLYPHNSVLEAVIVWGAPISAVLFLVYSFGLFVTFRSLRRVDFFPYLAVFFLFFSLKSGSWVSHWIFLVTFFHYFGVGADSLIKRNEKIGMPTR